MSIRLVSPAMCSFILLAAAACGPDSSPEPGGEASAASSSGEVKRPLSIEDAVAVGFTKQHQTLYSRIAAEDGWQGTFEGILVQIYVFPEIVPGYVPTSFFTDAVKKEATWQAHRIVRNVGILCGTEEVCANLEKKLRVTAGGAPRPGAQIARNAGAEASGSGHQPQPANRASEPSEGEGAGESQSGTEPTSPPADEPTARPGEEASSQPVAAEPEPVDPEPVEPEPETTPTAIRPSGPALPYSVAIASFSSMEDALAKRGELAGEGLTIFVAPVVVKGRTYYRLLAGALADRDAARTLQQSLVQKRIKREATAWDIRPANLAFHMGTYANASEALSAVQGLLEQKIPAYTIGGSNAVYVYAGGYEDEGDAAVLGDRIRAAGLEAELVERRGEAR